jgi:adenosylmethionine-8-amino-7-oxononanoate aminotransferase
LDDRLHARRPFACPGPTTPDLICLSKGLTGGFLPLAATVCRQEIYDAFLGGNFERAFAHGHSFTANPLGCAAALASLDLLQAPETTARLAAIESVHRERLARFAHHPRLTRPRVCGTIAAVPSGDQEGYSAEQGRLGVLPRARAADPAAGACGLSVAALLRQ